MQEIILSNGMTCQVSDCDYSELSKYKWTATYFCRKDEYGRFKKNEFKWYAARWECTDTYYKVKKGKHKGKLRKKQRKIYMHRWLMQTRAHHVTDHIDGNGLNNQRENLRNCTQKTNCSNRKEVD